MQLDIRQGHAQTVDKVLAWLDEEGGVAGTSVCDCGCGTGSLAIPLALRVQPPRNFIMPHNVTLRNPSANRVTAASAIPLGLRVWPRAKQIDRQGMLLPQSFPSQ